MGLAASLLVASCDLKDLKFLNQEPVFDDANAFVAFDNAAYTVSEDSQDILRIPVTLASVAGLEETVSYQITYPETKAAKQGVNFDLVSTSGVLSFNEAKRTDYIEVSFKYDGVYTGDLSFNIVLNEGATVGTGAANTCKITVADVDHPLSAILGTYTMSGTSYWEDGAVKWKMTLYKDDADDHKVWLNNLADVSTMRTLDFYGNVDEDLSTIIIPFGQETVYKYSYGEPLYLYGLDPSFNAYDSGSITVTIEKNASGEVTGLDFGSDYGFWVMSFKESAHENNVNFAILLPGITATKD